MSTPTLKEAARLHALGFAVLWIKPKSKAPVKFKWTTGPRDTWVELKTNYRPGYNMGVRLGTPSVVNGKYLAVIDVDVKSTEKRHQMEAEKAVAELFPQLPENTVRVLSGRGNGSSHIYILTDAPAQPSKRKVSADKIKTMMPSAAANQTQREQLSEEDLNEGWRMRPAWEVAVMGEGQQVVLPPSTHPDTGRAYVWGVNVDDAKTLQVVEVGHKKKDTTREATLDWQPENYDLTFSSLPDDIVQLVLYGDCDDHSAALFKVTIAMIKEGLTDRQIMSVLTDTAYVLGQTAYTHTKSDSRARAANWVYNYTLKKARKETDARFQFNDEVEIVTLPDDEVEKQLAELVTPPNWRDMIDRHGPKGVNANSPRATLKNLLLILTNEGGPDVFRRDDFALRDFYGRNTPWGGVEGAMLSDEDGIKIKVWLGARYRFEPSKDLVYEAMTFLAGKNSFDPVRDWLESLPEWDGVNRLDTWLVKNFEAEGDPDYLAQVFRKWIVAMVMRDYHPGSKFDWMPIFEGKQGIGKSSLGRLLVGEKYFLDWLPDLSDKDSALSLQGAWAVEFGELANLRKQDVESAKAFVTRTVDKVRPPYGRRWIESPRRCVFFGTTNSDTYLRDDSGNRRFKPVKVGNLNFEALHADRVQLFAEALFIWNNGFETERTLDIEGKARLYEAQIQTEKMVEDDSALMVETLLDFTAREAKKDSDLTFPITKFKTSWLFDSARGGPFADMRADQRNLVFAAKALKQLGGSKRFVHGYSYWKLPSHPPVGLSEKPKPKEIIWS